MGANSIETESDGEQAGGTGVSVRTGCIDGYILTHRNTVHIHAHEQTRAG